MKSDSFEKTLMLGKIKGGRKKGEGATVGEMVGWHHPLRHMSLNKLPEIGSYSEAWPVAVNGVAKSRIVVRD